MREIRFPKALVCVGEKSVTTIFEDGAASEFIPPVHDLEFIRVARWAGYGSALQFGLEHDVTHSWLADRLGFGVSPVVWAAAHGGVDGWRMWERETGREYPHRMDDDEHRTVRLQRYMNEGELDDDYGVLESTFGNELPMVARDLLLCLRPWLSP